MQSSEVSDEAITDGDAQGSMLVDSGETIIRFVNLSSFEFVRDDYGYELGEVMGNIVQTPGPVLKSFGGAETYDISNMMSSVAKHAVNMWVTWYCSKLSLRIGTRIVAPVQVFGIGPRPYWEILYDSRPGGEPRNWGKSGHDPADPFTWPPSLGIDIQGVSQSWHTALQVDVTLSDLPKQGAPK